MVIVARYTLSGPSASSPPLPLCPIHQRGLEFFCRTDNICICSVCVDKADHRGHSITPAKREWQIKKVRVPLISAARRRRVQTLDWTRLLFHLTAAVSFQWIGASVSTDGMSVSLCLLKSQLGISETELRDLLCEREKKVEDIQESLQEIQVSLDTHTIRRDEVTSHFFCALLAFPLGCG